VGVPVLFRFLSRQLIIGQYKAKYSCPILLYPARYETIQNMLSFQLDKKITRQLIALNELIVEKYAFLQTLPGDEKENIHHYAWISTVGASTRIENAVLTDSEIDWLDSVLGKDGKQTALAAHKSQIEDKLSRDKERSIEEVVGCRTVLLLIYRQAKEYLPLTEFTVRSLHHELLRYYTMPGMKKGDYKDKPNSVVQENHATGEKKSIFKTADPGITTQMAMKELIAWYNKAIQEEPWPISVAVELVYRFLAIHPFQDGNGRLGRALLLMSLLHSPNEKLSEVVYYLAIDRHIERHKEEYYIVLNQCSGGEYRADPTQYKIEYFLKYMLKVLQGAMSDIDFYAARAKAYKKLSASAIAVLTCFKDKAEEKIKTKDILEATGLPKRTITTSLKTLTDKAFIARYGQGAATYYQLIF
jgi:Fic family protein